MYLTVTIWLCDSWFSDWIFTFSMEPFSCTAGFVHTPYYVIINIFFISDSGTLCLLFYEYIWLCNSWSRSHAMHCSCTLCHCAVFESVKEAILSCMFYSAFCSWQRCLQGSDSVSVEMCFRNPGFCSLPYPSLSIRLYPNINPGNLFFGFTLRL